MPADTTIQPGYTTAAKVRASLGVTDNEVLDEFFNQDLGLALELDLLDWLPDHASVWEAYKTPGGTIEHRKAGILLTLYSMWFCSAYVANMWMALPQRISDGKVDMRRFSELDLKALAENAESKRDGFKQQLLEEEDPNAVFGYAQMGSARPTVDPVTGV